MSVQQAIDAAERVLPGQVARDGEEDARWQAIIAVGEFIESDPDLVWEFIKRWGVNPNDDVRAAIATCLLEHFIESHFEVFFRVVQELVRADRLFADTFRQCWKFGQSAQPTNAARFEALRREASKLAG